MTFCRYCNDRGCLVCDKHRAQRMRLQAQRDEAVDWLRSLDDARIHRVWDDAAIDLVAAAIQHGKELVRRELPSGEPSPGVERRFEMLELEDAPC